MGSERRRSTPSLDERSASPSEMAEAVPSEFLCPISGALMADPVIVPTGESFERSCIQACSDLAFTPPSLGLSTTSSSSSSLLLIPNVALKSAILNWCELNGLPRPRPLHPDAARDLVGRLMAPPPEPVAPKTPPPLSVRTKREPRSSSPFASSDTRKFEAPVGASIAGDYCSEEDILIKLLDPDPSDHEAAMVSLRSATRENRERRIALCTPRILAALRAALLSKRAAVQINAAAAMVNLSLEAPNKAAIVRSGAVPPLVEVLAEGHPEARDHAAGAIYSLALDEQNRAAIGVLGAIPPLVQLFRGGGAGGSRGHRARSDAGTALYYLSLAEMNRSKIARTPGAVRALLDAAAEAEAEAGVRRLAVMVVANLAGCAEGRAALMDGGAVAAVVGMMRAGRGRGRRSAMSRGSLRFRGLARAAGAEAVLARVAAAEGGGGGVRREMARRTLRAMRGDDDGMGGPAVGSVGFDDYDGTFEAPSEFLCPISGALMADPVIVPTGESFERSCVHACLDLAFTPPSLSHALDLSTSASASPLLIPNVALRNAILSWCDRSGLPRPAPLSPDAALDLVRSLMPRGPRSVRTRRENSLVAAGEAEEARDQEAPEVGDSSNTTSASSSPADSNVECSEDDILVKLMDSDPSEQEAALVSLRRATRASSEKRIALCTRRTLGALCLALLSRHPGVQLNAAAAVVNLSLEEPNKVPIVRAGAVPALVSVLRSENAAARDHAAAAIHSLALQAENRAAIGVLGAIPPLLRVFAGGDSDALPARRDAGAALYYLSLVGMNASKIAATSGAVRSLVAATAAGAEAALRRQALKVVASLAGTAEGRGALMDEGAVGAVVGMMREGGRGRRRSTAWRRCAG
ncbi:U-box domain-containing protein 40, partial [Ananas comosus]